MAGITVTIGASEVVTPVSSGSGLCSSQGLPVKKVESGFQEVNKPKGRWGTRDFTTELYLQGDKFSSVVLNCIFFCILVSLMCK